MFYFASCLCRVKVYGRSSLEVSCVVSLISLSGCYRVALSSICVGFLVVLGLYLEFVTPFWWVLPSTGFTGIHNSDLILYMIRGRAKVKWIKSEEYSMGFKVPARREKIGDPLENYCNNHDISPNQPLFIKGEK